MPAILRGIGALSEMRTVARAGIWILVYFGVHIYSRKNELNCFRANKGEENGGWIQGWISTEIHQSESAPEEDTAGYKTG